MRQTKSNPRIRKPKSESWDWKTIVYIRKAIIYPTFYPWLVFVPGERVNEFRWNKDAMKYAREKGREHGLRVIKGFCKHDLESWD